MKQGRNGSAPSTAERRLVKDVLLRSGVESDLERLSDLTEIVYGLRREPDILRWLLFSGPPGPEVESLVAERQGQVVGHVGSLNSNYRIHDRTARGAHRMLWMVEPGSRGVAGVPLGGSVPDAEFEVVLGGTPTTQAILELRGFQRAGEACELRLATATEEKEGSGLEVDLAPYDPAAVAADAGAERLVNIADPGHLTWLAACPEHEGLLFTLSRAGRTLGPLLLFVNRANDPPTGRIVHFPYLGEGAAPVLRAALAELASQGCAEATVLATENTLQVVAESLGGETVYRRPLWFRNPSGTMNQKAFYLTYMEGDLAYRRV